VSVSVPVYWSACDVPLCVCVCLWGWGKGAIKQVEGVVRGCFGAFDFVFLSSFSCFFFFTGGFKMKSLYCVGGKWYCICVCECSIYVYMGGWLLSDSELCMY